MPETNMADANRDWSALKEFLGRLDERLSMVITGQVKLEARLDNHAGKLEARLDDHAVKLDSLKSEIDQAKGAVSVWRWVAGAGAGAGGGSLLMQVLGALGKGS